MLFSTIDDLTTDRRTQVEPSTKKSSTDHLTNKQTRISVSTIASFGAAAQKRTQPHTKKKIPPKNPQPMLPVCLQPPTEFRENDSTSSLKFLLLSKNFFFFGGGGLLRQFLPHPSVPMLINVTTS